MLIPTEKRVFLARIALFSTLKDNLAVKKYKKIKKTSFLWKNFVL